MIYAVLREPDEKRPGLYCFTNYPDFFSCTFSPELEHIAAWSDKLTTRDKEQARDLLRRISDALFCPEASWSYRELATITASAERIARRAGLLREARENGII